MNSIPEEGTPRDNAIQRENQDLTWTTETEDYCNVHGIALYMGARSDFFLLFWKKPLLR